MSAELKPENQDGPETENKEAITSQPSIRWYIIPVFLGIIGGLIGYFAVRRRDEEMADNLLLVGLLTTPALVFLMVVLYWTL
jgi:H+/Cl- antiporter ClcA